MINRIDAVDVENNTELSRSIGLGDDYDENKIRQLQDWSYWYGLCQKKKSFHDWLNQVWSFTKTKQDNDVTDHIGLVYVEIEVELLGSISLGMVCDEY